MADNTEKLRKQVEKSTGSTATIAKALGISPALAKSCQNQIFEQGVEISDLQTERQNITPGNSDAGMTAGKMGVAVALEPVSAIFTVFTEASVKAAEDQADDPKNEAQADSTAQDATENSQPTNTSPSPLSMRMKPR